MQVAAEVPHLKFRIPSLVLMLAVCALPAAASAGPTHFLVPEPTPYVLAPEAAPAGLTRIESDEPAAQSLMALLDMNPYKPEHDDYLAWQKNPAEVWVASRAEAAARASANMRYTPDAFLLARRLGDGSELFTAELQSRADWYARTVPDSHQPTAGLLAKAQRVMSSPVSFDPAKADTTVYGATTVYAYAGGTMIAITDVVARIADRKVEIAAGVITHNATALEAAQRAYALANDAIRN